MIEMQINKNRLVKKNDKCCIDIIKVTTNLKQRKLEKMTPNLRGTTHVNYSFLFYRIILYEIRILKKIVEVNK